MSPTTPDKTIEPLAAVASHQQDVKGAPLGNAYHQEHELTLGDILRNHKPIAFWCLYWAMGAVGWYVWPSNSSWPLKNIPDFG